MRDTILDKAEFLSFEAKYYIKSEKIFRETYKMTGGASIKIEILFEILLMKIEKRRYSRDKKRHS